MTAQRPRQILSQFTYDDLADQIRGSGDLLVHYMTPLIDGNDGNAVFIMSRGDSTWAPCATNPAPCGTARWPQMTWGVTKLLAGRHQLEKQWTALSSWTPPPDDGSGWEPVFHPAIDRNYLYTPGGNGIVMKFDKRSGVLVDLFQPFGDTNPNRHIVSPLTIGADGSIYYSVLALAVADPWTTDAQEAWLVKIDPAGNPHKVSYTALVPGAPGAACSTTFDGQPLPWPPAPDSVTATRACGSQRPAVNSAPALATDGTVYVVSRAHLNDAYSYLVAVNSDLTPRWSATLRGRLADGCDVILPASGTIGGCGAGSHRGVDPATNELPAGRVLNQSSASPVVAPDGSILFGAFSRYNYDRGHMFRFSANGEFLASYDFGWDITPAIYAHSGTWSVVLKDNFYPVGSYCDVPGFCGQGIPSYSLTSLTPQLTREWTYANTNNQSCSRNSNGTATCQPSNDPFEWCVNMVAVDRNGIVYANSEDGNVYAIDNQGHLVGRVFLKTALGAAYTPLAIGGDGRVYTQNDGTLFVVGGLTEGVFRFP